MISASVIGFIVGRAASAWCASQIRRGFSDMSSCPDSLASNCFHV